ncbi:MAG: hypothetical protein ACR65O_06485 [Methylomicrobium sp.]
MIKAFLFNHAFLGEKCMFKLLLKLLFIYAISLSCYAAGKPSGSGGGGLPTSCTNGSVLQYNSVTSTWGCGPVLTTTITSSLLVQQTFQLFNNSELFGTITDIGFPYKATVSFRVNIDSRDFIIDTIYNPTDPSHPKIAYNGVVGWTNNDCSGIPALIANQQYLYPNAILTVAGSVHPPKLISDPDPLFYFAVSPSTSINSNQIQSIEFSEDVSYTDLDFTSPTFGQLITQRCFTTTEVATNNLLQQVGPWIQAVKSNFQVGTLTVETSP